MEASVSDGCSREARSGDCNGQEAAQRRLADLVPESVPLRFRLLPQKGLHHIGRSVTERFEILGEGQTDQLDRIKASIRAKVKHPFRVSKRQFGHVKVRYRRLAKNTAQLHTLFALSNPWMARRTLMGSQA